jgi:hypothetical protein
VTWSRDKDVENVGRGALDDHLFDKLRCASECQTLFV